MGKIFFVILMTFFLNGCFQALALVGPAATGVSTGNIYQSAVSYSLSYGIQKTTGKTVVQNVIDLNKKHKGDKDKDTVAINGRDDDLLNSFYPSTLKSIMLSR